jgi:RimJ/RimL family protein N-acetyltransferase
VQTSFAPIIVRSRQLNCDVPHQLAPWQFPPPDRLVGVIGYEGSPDPELGYWLDEPLWGKGIVSEAARAVVEHAFAKSHLDRLLSRCILGNEPSRRILVGLGFRPVGISSVYSSARGCDVVSQKFELTSKEWRVQ